ncbi:hypothetical protein [Rhodospirillum sp. A1_3_36]|uniref:hypothetical protein n=1 Tax=Rhodospirillum sp. A1_3_36 TaxID=3391666 RepID=UPI0039A5B921
MAFNVTAHYPKSPKDLQGKTVGIGEGFDARSLFQAQFPDINFIEVKSVTEGLRQMSSNRIDAYFDSLAVISNSLDNNPMPNVGLALGHGAGVFTKDGGGGTAVSISPSQ